MIFQATLVRIFLGFIFQANLGCSYIFLFEYFQVLVDAQTKLDIPLSDPTNKLHGDQVCVDFPVNIQLLLLQGDFFNWPSPENVSRLAPPKFAWSGPP